MDVKGIIAMVNGFLPSWVSASCEEISQKGPRHLPRSWPNRNAASSSDHADPKTLVIGGRNSELGQFPFIVSLQGSDGHYCGGSIINKHTVLTAAHCVEGQTVDTLKVVAGKLRLNKKEESQQIRNVNSVVIHPGYTPTGPDHVSTDDVALLFVKDPFKFNKFVGKIALANPMDNEYRGNATVAGWGNTEKETNVSYPKTMKTALLRMYSHSECVAQMKKENSFNVTETMLCTLNVDNGAGSGDSGGPLVQGDKLIGIVSWGPKIWKPQSVSGFTRVSSFTEWIMKEIQAREAS